MFERQSDYPCAVVDQDAMGEQRALDWCSQYMASGQHLVLWVAQKNILRNNDFLVYLSNHPRVEVVTGRGSGFFVANGPVLAMYPRVEELGTIMGASGITALCVVRWDYSLSTWIKEVNATILHKAENWKFADQSDCDLNHTIIEALQQMTDLVNHNNTIAAGYEKKVVVLHLLRLHDEGVALPSATMVEWAAAHGWREKNVKKLGEYIDQINSGVRPRTIR